MPKNPVANHPKHKRLDINRSPLGAVPGYGSSMITRAASPPFDRFGLLPGGIHECTIKEIEVDLAWNDNRRRLSALLQKFIAVDLTPRFTTVPPVVLDGSDVSKKASPSNINLMLELSNLPDADQRPYLEMLAQLSSHSGLLQAVTHHPLLVPDQFSLSPLSLRWMRPSAPGLISPETAACSRQA